MECGILVRFSARRCASGEHLRELYEFRGTISINLRVGYLVTSPDRVRRGRMATKTRVAAIP
jgi:hypothetical protein